MYNKRTNINGMLIKSKARKLISLYNERTQPGQHIEITYYNGWLSRFKARWGLRKFKSYGQSGDTNNEAVQIALSVFDNVSLFF